MFKSKNNQLNGLTKLLVASGIVIASVNANASTSIVLDFDFTISPVLTFDPFGLEPTLPVGSGGVYISQQYGDLPGLLDAGYRYINTDNQHVSSLRTWIAGYDELEFVAWGGDGTTSQGGDIAQVELASVNNSLVTLNSFRLGSWSGSAGKEETVRVYEIGNNTPVFEFTGLIGIDNVSNLFNLSDLQSASGYIIEWTNPWWTAIDDIHLSAVPMPSSIWLFSSAMAGLIGLRRMNGKLVG